VLQATVLIEKILYGGEGLARLPSGKVVFVPYTLPGERVRIIVHEEYKDFARGHPVEILEASPERSQAPCRYYELCGGCQFQHLPYERELKIKEENLRELFQRQGRGEVPLREVIPSPRLYQYRNRLRLHVESHPFKMGFVKKGTHEVLKIEECLLGERPLNEVLRNLYQSEVWLSLSLYTKRLRLEYSPLDEKVSLVFWVLFPPKKEELLRLSQLSSLKSLFYFTRGSRPVGPFPEEVPHSGRKLFPALAGLTYYISPFVFTQTNWEVNLKIMAKVLELSAQAESILDLHAGMGNFLLPLVRELKEARAFLGVDTDLRAIEDGLYTAEKNGLNGRLELRKMSALEALYQASQEGKTYEAILLDPPRGGCKELLRLLPQVASKYLLYVSCDPPTFVRDLILLEKAGFTLSQVYLYDMFPRTYHFEVLGFLEKKG